MAATNNLSLSQFRGHLEHMGPDDTDHEFHGGDYAYSDSSGEGTRGTTGGQGKWSSYKPEPRW